MICNSIVRDNMNKIQSTDQASELLVDWETSVKLPERYPLRDTIEGRREAVKRLISKYPV